MVIGFTCGEEPDIPIRQINPSTNWTNVFKIVNSYPSYYTILSCKSNILSINTHFSPFLAKGSAF